MKKVTYFASLFMAKLTGNDAEAKTIEAQENCLASLKLGISKAEYEIQLAKNAVNIAEKHMLDARSNYGKVEVSEMSYVNGLLEAKNVLEKANESLDLATKRFNFLKEEYTLLESAK